MAAIPSKLKVDTIAEALCEVQFDCNESHQFPELVIGKIVGHEPWSGFDKTRLPIADFPASIRTMDQSLRFQPVMELRQPQGTLIIKVGANVLSVHRVAPYPGGDVFAADIEGAIKFLFDSFSQISTHRLGLRYLNIFTEQEHGLKTVSELHQSISVAGKNLSEPMNLNYFKKHGPEHTALVRIASPEFVAGPFSKPFQALVDVDVFTPIGLSCKDAAHAKHWLAEAREYEKREFFALFTDELWNRLVEAG